MGLKNFVSKFIKVQRAIGVMLAIFLPLLIVIQVILRYVFKAPLMGIEELMLFPTIWLYMIGGANASQEKSHIECGILTLYIKKPRSMQIFKIFKGAFSVAISIWLTYWSYWLFSYSLKLWKTSNLLYIPMFFAESAMFIGLVLMTIYASYELYEYIIDFKNGPEIEGGL